MTRSEAAKICQSIKFMMDKDDYSEAVEEALNMAIEALQQQRQEILPKHCIVPSGDYVATAGVPKRGYWLEAKEEDPCWYRCSECGRLYDLDENYCPNCGARMESDEE